jgi:NAD(P)-dependent dehydrogenase (short-subunit alcohol dehydrogenase family)
MSNQQSYKRVWLITGAARGLGAQIAEAAIAGGNAVIAAGGIPGRSLRGLATIRLCCR